MNFAIEFSSMYKSGCLFWKNLNVETALQSGIGDYFPGWSVCSVVLKKQSIRNLNCRSLIRFTVLLYDYFSRSQWHIQLAMLQQL